MESMCGEWGGVGGGGGAGSRGWQGKGPIVVLELNPVNSAAQTPSPSAIAFPE